LGEFEWPARIEGGGQGRRGRKINGAADRRPSTRLREGAHSAVVRGVDGLDASLRNSSMGRRWVDDGGCRWLTVTARGWRGMGKVETGTGSVVSWGGDGRKRIGRGTPGSGSVQRDVVVVELLGEGGQGRGGEGVVGGT